MPDLRSAMDFIKQVNPKNVSGVIPQALEIQTEMKKVTDVMNPKMFEMVGLQNLIGALRHIQNQFHLTGIINELISKALQGGPNARKMMNLANTLTRNSSNEASNMEQLTQIANLNISSIQNHLDEAVKIEQKIESLVSKNG
jgi:hypothetical protein